MRKKDPLFPATFHQGCPYLTIIYLAVNYILTLHSVSGSLGVRFPRGPQGRGPAPSPSRTPPVQWLPFPSTAQGSDRTRMCSDGTAGGRKPYRQGGQAGSRRARFGLPNLCRKNREALADRFFVDGPLEADCPPCRGLIIPGGVRPLTAQRPAPRGGRCRRSPAPVTASLEQGSGRPKIVLGRPILVREFSPEGPLRSAGTSPAPRPRPGSRA